MIIETMYKQVFMMHRVIFAFLAPKQNHAFVVLNTNCLNQISFKYFEQKPKPTFKKRLFPQQMHP